MNLSYLKLVLDKELVFVFLCSIINFLYTNFIILLIKYIDDEKLFFINSNIKININNDLDDLFSDSDSDDLDSNDNNINTLDAYNKHLILWEYEVILRMFNIPNILLNILNESELSKIPIRFNNNIKTELEMYNLPNTINIIDCFLFNIKINKNSLIKKQKFEINNKSELNELDIDLNDIQNIKKKIILIYHLSNKLNSNNIYNLFSKYKYLYILYKKYDNTYSYILIDLHNNFDLIKNKKLLFNNIKF
jgi:hypothetical protein